ncbi:hypothetical protein DL93DRAFT_2077658 [Clavulina sp. PMI_390]|nr:hypothetical protein DL93DRAFT_2077658 [Clavulina sp. PMI_390]
MSRNAISSPICYNKPTDSSMEPVGHANDIFSGDDPICDMTLCTPPSSTKSRISNIIHKSIHPLKQTPSHTSLERVNTVASTVSVIPPYGVIYLSLQELCRYVSEQETLRLASIVSSECYSEPIGPVTHRFVVMKLRREGRKVVWLRLDRR